MQMVLRAAGYGPGLTWPPSFFPRVLPWSGPQTVSCVFTHSCFFHVLQLAAHQPPLHWSWLVIIKTKCVLWCCAIWNYPDVMYASSSSTSPDHHGQQQLLLFVTCVRPVIVSCRWCPDVTSSHRVIASAWAICVTVFVRLRQSSVFRRPSSCDRSCLRACTPSPFLSSRVLACACPTAPRFQI